MELSLLSMANRMMFEFGVLPDSFFSQRLKRFLKVVGVKKDDNHMITSSDVIDEVGL